VLLHAAFKGHSTHARARVQCTRALAFPGGTEACGPNYFDKHPFEKDLQTFTHRSALCGPGDDEGYNTSFGDTRMVLRSACARLDAISAVKESMHGHRRVSPKPPPRTWRPARRQVAHFTAPLSELAFVCHTADAVKECEYNPGSSEWQRCSIANVLLHNTLLRPPITTSVLCPKTQGAPFTMSQGCPAYSIMPWSHCWIYQCSLTSVQAGLFCWFSYNIRP
jgi:hypothetical protein